PRPATIDQIRRPVVDHLLVLGNVGLVRFDCGDPPVEHCPGVGKWYARPAPHYVVADVTVSLTQALPNRKSVPLIVISRRVVVAAHVEHRDVTKTAVPAHVKTGLVDALDRARVAHATGRHVVEVRVVAADALVQIEKL